MPRREPALALPPAFGITHQALMEFGVRERAAADAVVRHAAVLEDLLTLERALSSAMFAVREARKKAKECALEVSDLDTAAQLLLERARALMGVIERHRATGAIGCNAEQREHLLALGDDMDTLRRAIPRRIWIIAMRRVEVGERARVPR